MNGFLVLTDERPKDIERILPPEKELSYRIKNFAGGEIVLWGAASGDVHFVEEENERFFLLNGYITEIECDPEFVTQQDACRLIMDRLRNHRSQAEIRDCLMRIHGSFSLVYYDVKESTIFCITDRMASRPIFFAWDSKRWIISTHAMAVALAMATVRFDLAGVAAFLLYGGPIDPSFTIFEDIRAISSGTEGRLMPDGRFQETQWYKFIHAPDNRMALSEWTDLIADRLVNASKRLLKHSRKPAVFFSGGTDSRLAAAALKAAGGNPLLVTLSSGPNLETRVAVHAAKALGLDQSIVPRDKHWYLRNVHRAMYETGGNYMWGHGHFAEAARLVSQQHDVDAFVLGDMCEAFSKLLCEVAKPHNSIWSAQEFIEKFDSIHLPLYRPSNRRMTLGLLNKSIQSEADTIQRKRIEKRYEVIRSMSSDPHILGDLVLRWESVSSSPTFFMFMDLRSTVSERNVMFDPEIHELLERLPSRMRNGRNLGALLIKRLAPRAGMVVNSNTLVPMSWPSMLHKTAKRIKPMIGRIRRAMFGQSYLSTGSWQELPYLCLTDPVWRDFMNPVLSEADYFDKEIFDRDNIRNSWRSFLSGNLNLWADMDRVLQIGILSVLLKGGIKSLPNKGF